MRLPVGRCRLTLLPASACSPLPHSRAERPTPLPSEERLKAESSVGVEFYVASAGVAEPAWNDVYKRAFFHGGGGSAASGRDEKETSFEQLKADVYKHVYNLTFAVSDSPTPEFEMRLVPAGSLVDADSKAAAVAAFPGSPLVKLDSWQKLPKVLDALRLGVATLVVSPLPPPVSGAVRVVVHPTQFSYIRHTKLVDIETSAFRREGHELLLKALDLKGPKDQKELRVVKLDAPLTSVMLDACLSERVMVDDHIIDVAVGTGLPLYPIKMPVDNTPSFKNELQKVHKTFSSTSSPLLLLSFSLFSSPSLFSLHPSFLRGGSVDTGGSDGGSWGLGSASISSSPCSLSCGNN